MAKKRINSASANISVRTFAEMHGEQKLLHVLPLGKWDHPSYGEMEITPATVDEFVRNFDARVRLDIPITEGHEVADEKPAVGWFKKLHNRGAEGLFAEVDWNARGLEALNNEEYKYFSPEFHFAYNDPETRQDYQNVLVGGALTNKPYFKVLRPVMFSEPKSNIIIQFNENDIMDIKSILAKDKATLSNEELSYLKEHKDELTPEQQTEYKDQLDLTPAPAKDTPPENQPKPEDKNTPPANPPADQPNKASEPKPGMVMLSEAEVAKFRETSQKLEFREVQDMLAPFIFSATNKKGKILPAHKDQVEKFVFSLNKDQRASLVDIVKKMPDAKLFNEVGDGGDKPAGGSALDKINAEIKTKQTANPALSYNEAYQQVISANPQLKKDYDAERAGK